MTTKKKKSKTMRFLDKLTGGPLTLGSYLEAIRLGEEETLESFAQQLGISRSHLSDIEKGHKGVTPERAARFSKLLGYPEKQFVQLAIEDQLRRAGLDYKVKVA